MKKDILIEEIRNVRHEISERFNHNAKALVEHYRELEQKYKHRMLKAPIAPVTKREIISSINSLLKYIGM